MAANTKETKRAAYPAYKPSGDVPEFWAVHRPKRIERLAGVST
jgi:hypothetical protein